MYSRRKPGGGRNACAFDYRCLYKSARGGTSFGARCTSFGGSRQRERRLQREREICKTGERRPPTIVSGVRARARPANIQRYTFPDFISALKMLGTSRIPSLLTTNVARDSSFSRLSSPNIEALFSLQRTTPLLPLA